MWRYVKDLFETSHKTDGTQVRFTCDVVQRILIRVVMLNERAKIVAGFQYGFKETGQRRRRVAANHQKEQIVLPEQMITRTIYH